jgi:hypothetical protein
MAQIERELLEPCRRREHEHACGFDIDGETVRDASRPEHESASRCFKHVVGHVESHLPFEHVPRLVFAVMDVQWRFGRVEDRS